MTMFRNRYSPLLTLAIALTAGCASTATIPEAPLAETPDNLEFQRRENPGIPLSRFFGSPDRSEERTTPASVVQPARIAVVIDARSGVSGARLQSALSRLSPQHNLLLLPTGAVQESLAGADCGNMLSRPCLDSVAVFPGVDVLVELRTAPGDASTVRAIFADTLTGAVSAPVDLEKPRAGDADAYDALADAILLNAAQRAALTPWAARAFGGGGSSWQINAGKRSGLKIGDVLEIRAGGQVLRAPSGAIAGWVPGPVKGRLRVEQLVGEDVAIAKLIEGEAPTPQNPLTKAQ